MIDAEIYQAAEELLAAARAKGAMIATAESCTGGLIIGALTEVAGSSDVVERGFVTYSNEAKAEMLGVPADLIAAHGAVSEPVARAMAEGALRRSRAQLAVSVTGVAGPGASEAKPAGLVCFGLATQDGATTETRRFDQQGAQTRAAVRRASVLRAIALLRRAVG